MGVSLILYPIRDSKTISKELDLESEVEANIESCLYLGEFYVDIGNILTNTIDWSHLIEKNGYKAIMGINFEPKPWYAVIGYLNNNQTSDVYQWLISLKIVDEKSFSHFIDTYLSGEVKITLEFESPTRNVLYNDFFEPLLAFYKQTIEEGKGILFTLE